MWRFLISSSQLSVLSRDPKVLSDPQLRAAYDEYGEEGLSTKREVGHRVKTAQEVTGHTILLP